MLEMRELINNKQQQSIDKPDKLTQFNAYAAHMQQELKRNSLDEKICQTL
jgi:hypothetical protein